MTVLSEYDQQANNFLDITDTSFKADFVKYGKHFDSDTDERDIYRINLKRGDRVYSFDFGQSIFCSRQYTALTNYAKQLTEGKELRGETFIGALANSRIQNRSFIKNDFKKNENFKEPTAYDVLACLQDYEVGTLENFCGEFGYDLDSKQAEKTYKAVLEEWQNVKMLWNDKEITLLQEIQ